MRALPFIMLACFSAAVCQTAPQQRDAGHIVRSMLSHDSALYGGYTSWDEKALSRSGDAACVAASDFLEGKEMDVTDIRTTLLIIRFSFEAPAEIKNESDREPRAALLLLQKLQALPAASSLADDLAYTRKVLRRASRSKTQ